MASVMFPFIVMENPQWRGEAEQFVMGQAKFPTARMLMAEVIIDGKGFVERTPFGFSASISAGNSGRCK